MARDYARGRSSRRNARHNNMTPRGGRRPSRQGGGGSNRSPLFHSLLLLSAGMLVGLLIAGLLFIRSERAPNQIVATEKTSETKAATAQSQTDKHTSQAKAHSQKKPTQSTEPHYDFYTTLPKDTVETTPPAPKEKSSPSSSLPQKQSAATPASSDNKAKNTAATHYLVQVATVSHFKDAERLKAQLALLGYKAAVTRITHRGNPSFRVSVGPYLNAKVANTEQTNLKKNNIDSIVLAILDD